MKSRPNYHETTRAIVSMSIVAGQNPQIVSRRNKCRDDLDPEKLEWLVWLSYNWKWFFAVHEHTDVNPIQMPHQESEDEPASGNREEWTPISDKWWSASRWTDLWWEKSKWTWSEDLQGC